VKWRSESDNRANTKAQLHRFVALELVSELHKSYLFSGRYLAEEQAHPSGNAGFATAGHSTDLAAPPLPVGRRRDMPEQRHY
jgi:hypothetical protein